MRAERQNPGKSCFRQENSGPFFHVDGKDILTQDHSTARPGRAHAALEKLAKTFAASLGLRPKGGREPWPVFAPSRPYCWQQNDKSIPGERKTKL